MPRKRRRNVLPGDPDFRPCLHCGAGHANRPRGLCMKCYDLPGLRAAYPITSIYATKSEPTAAEVERCVAEQYANLPEWWDKESRRESESEGLS